MLALCILIKLEWGLGETLGVFTLLQVRNFSRFYRDNWPNLPTGPLEKKQPAMCIFVLYRHNLQGCYLPTPAATHFTQPFISILQNHGIYPPSLCQRKFHLSYLSCRYHKADRKKKRRIFLCAKADTLQYCQKCSESTGWEEKAQDNTIRRIYKNSRLTVTHPHSTKLLKVDHHPP